MKVRYLIFIFTINNSTNILMILDGGNENTESEVKETVRIPHSRADLLNKFELLRVANDDEDDDEDDGEDENDSDIDFEDGSFSDES